MGCVCVCARARRCVLVSSNVVSAPHCPPGEHLHGAHCLLPISDVDQCSQPKGAQPRLSPARSCANRSILTLLVYLFLCCKTGPTHMYTPNVDQSWTETHNQHHPKSNAEPDETSLLCQPCFPVLWLLGSCLCTPFNLHHPRLDLVACRLSLPSGLPPACLVLEDPSPSPSYEYQTSGTSHTYQPHLTDELFAIVDPFSIDSGSALSSFLHLDCILCATFFVGTCGGGEFVQITKLGHKRKSRVGQRPPGQSFTYLPASLI
ncbi:hypothetical protein CGRA01v4_11711 [Colletotrichum graminicola]|nr:hypothetical protein CGRA01v4_11711 [Colletotrichum graminicola]